MRNLNTLRLPLLLCVLAALSLSGCAALQPLPTQELGVYTEAVAETRAVAEQVLQTWDKAARTARAREAASAREAGGEGALPYPSSFNAREVLQSAQAPDPVAVRLLAFDTVSRYTDLLVTLAEGKSVAQVQASAEQLRVNLQTVTDLLSMAPIPGLAAAGPLLRTFAGTLERARLRAQFRKAAKEGEPVVAKILDFLIEDTTGADEASGYYATVFALENEKRLKLRRKIIDAAGSIRRIVREHAAPTDPDLIANLDKGMKAVLGALVPPKEAPDLASRGSAPFSNLAQSQVMTELERMEAYDRNRRKTMEGVNAYHALLTIYVRLLGQTRSDLNQLVVALARPIDAQAAFERTLALALRAHREIRTVQDSL